METVRIVVNLKSGARLAHCQSCIGIEFVESRDRGNWAHVFLCANCNRVKHSTMSQELDLKDRVLVCSLG